jgi:hypothetical protein
MRVHPFLSVAAAVADPAITDVACPAEFAVTLRVATKYHKFSPFTAKQFEYVSNVAEFFNINSAHVDVAMRTICVIGLLSVTHADHPIEVPNIT